MKNLIVLASLFLIMIGNAQAESRYVSDKLEITLRSGKGNSYSITRMLSSGTQVEVLEVDKSKGYSKIRTKSGKEGWRLELPGQVFNTRLLALGRPADDAVAF